jgi:hypothetical protein
MQSLLCQTKISNYVKFEVLTALTMKVTSSGTFRTSDAIHSYETSVLTRATRRNIPGDAILHSHRRENLKSYIALAGWTL